MADHELRPECAKEFGSIQKGLEFHKEWRDEQRVALSTLQREVEKLTGNGNRGRIDGISDDISEIKTMLVGHIAEAEERDHRLDTHDKLLEKYEGRVYAISLKVAGVVAFLAMVIKLGIDRL
jgi:hypothetical protein